VNTASGPGSPAGLRDANRSRVLAAVRGSGDPTQAAVAAATGLAPATVSNIVRELVARGELESSDAVRGGRRVRLVRLPRAAGLVAGVDFGHRHVRVAVADLAHRVLAEGRADLPRGHGPDDGLDAADALLADALHRAGAHRGELLGAGVGLPAPVDAATGTVGAPGILPGWVGVAPAARAAERLGPPVWVDNDATLGTLAETRWGALAGIDDGLYVKLADGVGAGLVLGGRPYRGPTGTAGEIGHVVVEEGGPVCRCGNRGCLETLVSTSTVVALLEPLLGSPLTIAEIVARAHDGHAPSARVLADTGHRVGIALGGLCSILTPSRVVVGGELALAGELLLDPLRTALHHSALPGAVHLVTVVLAALGERAHVLGAVALALDRVTPEPPG